MRTILITAVLGALLAVEAPAQFGRRQVEASESATFHGTAGAVHKGKLELELENENIMLFQLSRKTKYYDGDKPAKASDIAPGIRISVDGRRAADGVLEAMVVRIVRDKKPAPAAK